ncbi:unnamed protein product [Schistosoma margrebowiei]|uniref:Uncharacterized protein n=1 Tax=Schistosoma margrebowiei TaxID=48269 RepID=A0A3P8D4E4_9TREM|nr:unnamed protein product [Schistosoma margrebowiei]
MLNVQRCDSSKVFPSNNQHAYAQGGMGLGKVYPKNAHLALS